MVSFLILRPFGPFPVNTMLRAGHEDRRPRLEPVVGLVAGERFIRSVTGDDG